MHLKFITLVFAGMILGGLCHAQPTQLGIDRNAGPARLNVQGETNRDYAVFGSDALSGRVKPNHNPYNVWIQTLGQLKTTSRLEKVWFRWPHGWCLEAALMNR